MGEYTCETCGESFDTAPAYAGHKGGCGNLPWDDPDLLRRLYHDEKMSMSEIAERWDEANRSKVAWQFRKHDIETRDRGEGKRLDNRGVVSISMVRGRLRLAFQEFGEHRQFPLARLIAMSEHSLDELEGHHVHHKNGCAFDDRLSNLEVKTPSEHGKHHAHDDGPPNYSAERRREIAEERERDGAGRFA